MRSNGLRIDGGRESDTDDGRTLDSKHTHTSTQEHRVRTGTCIAANGRKPVGFDWQEKREEEREGALSLSLSLARLPFVEIFRGRDN